MAKLINLARMYTTTTGAGSPLSLFARVPGFLTFEHADAVDGETYTYGISDGEQSEVCTGVYSASGPSITRVTIKSTNNDAPISLSGLAEVFVTPSASSFEQGSVRHPSGETTYTITTSDLGSRQIATNDTDAMTWTLPACTGAFATGIGVKITNEGVQPLFVNAANGSLFNPYGGTPNGFSQTEISQSQTVDFAPDGNGGWIADIGQTAYSNGYEKSLHFTSYSLSNGGPFFTLSGTPTIGDVVGFDYTYDTTYPATNTLSFRYTFTTNTVAELETAAKNLVTQMQSNATLVALLGPDQAQYFVAVQTAPLPTPQWLVAMNQVWPFNPDNHPYATVYNSGGHTATFALANDIGGGAVTTDLDIGSWIGLGRGTRYAGREPQAGDRIAGIFVSGETTGNSFDNHNYQPIYSSFQWTITDPTPGLAKASLGVTAGGGINLAVGNTVWGVNQVGITGGRLSVDANLTGVGGVAPPTGTMLSVYGTDAGGSYITTRAFGGPGGLVMQATGGTGGTPVAIGGSTTLGAVSFGGSNGVPGYTQSAAIDAVSTETYTSAHSGSAVRIYTTPTGSNTLTVRVQVQQSGGLSVGNTYDTGGAGRITAISNTALSFSLLSGTRFYAASADAASTVAMLECFGATSGNVFAGRASGGTGTTPTATPSSTSLATLNGYGFTDALKSTPSGTVAVVTDSLWTASNAATHISFSTTPTGSLTLTEAVRVQPSGGLAVGNVYDSGSVGRLTAISNTAASFTIPAGTRFYGAAVDGTNTIAMLESFGSTGNVIVGRASGGTGTTPTATTAGTSLLSFNGEGYTTSLLSAPNAAIAMVADSLWSVSNSATRIVFLTTPTGTGSPVEAVRIQPSGGLAVGTTSDPGVGAIYTNSAGFLIRTKTSYTDHAAAQTATMTNGPAAGNPTKWIAIDDNGTTRYIPAW